MWKSPLLRFPSVRGNGGKPAVGFPPFPQRVISTDSRWNLFTHRLCYRTEKVLWLLKLLLDATGKQGVPQGGVISPLLSNLYLNEVDQMLERAKAVTRRERWTAVEYARFADDLVILVDSQPRQQWLRQAVEKRLREELAKLQVEVNEEKSRKVDLQQGESFGFLGFE